MNRNEGGEIKMERSQMPSAIPKKVLVKKPSNVEKQETPSMNHQEILDDRHKIKQQQYEEARARILQNQTTQRNQQKYNQDFPPLTK